MQFLYKMILLINRLRLLLIFIYSGILTGQQVSGQLISVNFVSIGNVRKVGSLCFFAIVKGEAKVLLVYQWQTAAKTVQHFDHIYAETLIKVTSPWIVWIPGILLTRGHTSLVLYIRLRRLGFRNGIADDLYSKPSKFEYWFRTD